MRSKEFNIQVVVATDKNGGIGKNNRLPWQSKLKTDMAFFKEVTTSQHQFNVFRHFFEGKDKLSVTECFSTDRKNVVIMGRKTWDSIPKKFKPLEGRLNIVLSRTTTQIEGATCFNSLDSAIASLEYDPTVNYVFIIGGSQVYSEALKHPLCKRVFLTSIEQEFNCDTFLDLKDLNNFSVTSASAPITENEITYTFKALIKNESI